jgi:tetratricopeptide (TPR) repeat protein
MFTFQRFLPTRHQTARNLWQLRLWQLRRLKQICTIGLVGSGLWLGSITESTYAQRPTPPSGQTQPQSLPTTAEDNFAQGNITRAMQIWSREIKNGPDPVRSLFNRAQAYIILKQYDAALIDLDQLIKRQGVTTPAAVFVLKGVALAESNQVTAALQAFNRAEQVEPSALIYSNRALVYQRSGQLLLALEDLTRAVQLAPNAINRLNMASLRLQLEQYPQVVQEMNQFIAVDKSFFSAFLTRGIAQYNLGKYEESIKDFIISLRMVPDLPEAYYYAGLAFAKLNQKQDAAQNLTRAADIYLRNNQASYYRQVLDKMTELNLQ